MGEARRYGLIGDRTRTPKRRQPGFDHRRIRFLFYLGQYMITATPATPPDHIEPIRPQGGALSSETVVQGFYEAHFSSSFF